jgi:subtilisin family serine protease
MLRRSVFALSIVVSVGFVLSAEAASVPNRVLVKFKDAALLSRVSARELGAMQIQGFVTPDTAIVRYSTRLSAIEASRELRRDSDVAWAQPDYLLSIFPIVSDVEAAESSPFASLLSPFAPSKPGYVTAPALPAPAPDSRLSELWGMNKISAAAAWNLTRGDTKVVVADIDTGIDYTHPNLIHNLWTNPNPDPVMKDVHGYDFAGNDGQPYDDHMHGTHTAGTIGATGGHGLGISGVSPRVSIMGLKFISKEGSGTTSDAVRAIDYAVTRGARVLSNSWGGSTEDAEENKVLEDAVERANQADVLFVAAAGNDGTDNDSKPVYPAAIRKPNVLTVASTNDRDGRSFFSNYGKETVHVGAPGSSILSTVPGGRYEKTSGTSMACPHVAGLAALILAQKPGLSAVEVKRIIMESVDALPALQGLTVTGGRINAAAALQKAMLLGAR